MPSSTLRESVGAANIALSDIPGMSWPAIPSQRNAILSCLVKDLELGNTQTADTLQRRQDQQLTALLKHANATCPFYAERLAQAGFAPGDSRPSSSWERIQPLTRMELQRERSRLTSQAIPLQHGTTFWDSTSGSSGSPVLVLKTALTGLLFDAFTIHEHVIHGRDFSKKHAFLKFFKDPAFAAGALVQDTWGPPVSRIYASGSSVAMSVETPIQQQSEFLQRERPQYILSYPSNLAALAQHLRSRNACLSGLEQLRTLGETLSPSTRNLCKEAFGVPVIDTYSCSEVGYLAVQCPTHMHYHAAMENAVVEVLDDENRPCLPGEEGRVVVTSLTNFAMPLVRYDIGDRAIQGCSPTCGLPQPIIKTVLGRSRDMLKLPSGEQVWPSLRLHLLGPRCGAEIRQAQVVQKSLDRIIVRIVSPKALNPAQEQIISQMLQDTLRHPFSIEFEYSREPLNGSRGKFHDFSCEIA